MAQPARPHSYTHREYFRLMLSRLVSGLGRRPFSTRPISASHPPQHALAPGVDEAEEQDEHEEAHLDQAEAAVDLELGGPGEDEHRLHVEHHEEQGEHVVADLA